MRAVLQRVSSAHVRVARLDAQDALSQPKGAGHRVTGEIATGLLVLVGVGRGDTDEDVRYIAAKIRDIRIFPSEDGARPMDRSVVDVGASVLVVSQFTLYGDVRKGRRPAFDEAAAPDEARAHYEALVRELRAALVPVETGEFRATMQVELVNEGPVTILIDSRRQF